MCDREGLFTPPSPFMSCPETTHPESGLEHLTYRTLLGDCFCTIVRTLRNEQIAKNQINTTLSREIQKEKK